MDAFRDCDQGIYISYRSSGKLFNIRRFAAKTKVLMALVRDLLYADDCDLVAHTESDMQCFMDRLLEACRAFGLTISLNKTVVMFQPAPGTVYVEPSIYTDGKKLKIVDKFTYLGSTINRFCSLDDEIALRLKKQREPSLPWNIVCGCRGDWKRVPSSKCTMPVCWHAFYTHVKREWCTEDI